jgi:hypothetical protein
MNQAGISREDIGGIRYCPESGIRYCPGIGQDSKYRGPVMMPDKVTCRPP